MKSIKELLEAEYIGKEITVFKQLFLNGTVSELVASKYYNPRMSGDEITLKVVSVEKHEGSCCGYEYSLRLEGGFYLYVD